jgi:3alpha(or 20beta)-hydroxysteroid dehydrogenase
MTHSHDFTGQVIVVTGGARGQGAAHVRLMAERGAVLYALDLRDEEGAKLEESLQSQGHDVTYRHHDVASVEDWEVLVADLDSRHGRLDVLVNNAGIVHTATITDESLQGFERVMRVNATGTFLGMKSCWSLLAASDAASIVNIASVYGLHSNPGYVAYTASKAAVIGMTKTAAMEGAPLGIRANVISPGTVQTEQLKDEEHGYVREATPLDRGADVSEIAACVAFLASCDSSFVTGVELHVDGGFAVH